MRSYSMLNVNEIFYTIQGEGPYTGKPSIFLRLSGCNLRCYWCDTSYTWLYSKEMRDKIQKKMEERDISAELTLYDRDSETHSMDIETIIKQLTEHPGKHVVISGGEPLLQVDSLVTLTQMLIDLGYSIEIETNGTKSPGNLPKQIRYNVSPKLDNSLNDKDRRYVPQVLQEFISRDAIFKFVVTKTEDLKEIEEIIGDINIPAERIYLMPEGRSSEELLDKSRWLVDICKARNYNYTHRLHIDLFDKTRGV